MLVADGMKAVCQYDQITMRISVAAGNKTDPLARVRVRASQIANDSLSQARRPPLRRSARRRARPPRHPAARRGGRGRRGELGEYEALRISLGVPKGGVDFAYGEAFPHDADMDLFHGVDFEKGCYVGQEVVSRMKHRGEARKRVARVSLDGAGAAAGRGGDDGELPVGVLGSSSGRHALALLRLDRVEAAKAAGRQLERRGRRGGVERRRVDARLDEDRRRGPRRAASRAARQKPALARRPPRRMALAARRSRLQSAPSRERRRASGGSAAFRGEIHAR